jgi:hypothetical protein
MIGIDAKNFDHDVFSIRYSANAICEGSSTICTAISVKAALEAGHQYKPIDIRKPCEGRSVVGMMAQQVGSF